MYYKKNPHIPLTRNNLSLSFGGGGVPRQIVVIHGRDTKVQFVQKRQRCTHSACQGARASGFKV